MHEQWAVIWTTLLRERRGDRARGLDDPLDGPEWDGLRWALAIFSFLQCRGSRLTLRPARAAATAKRRRGAIVGHAAAPAACSDRASVTR